MANQIITDVVSGSLTYTGEAIPGTPTSEKSWTIKKTAVSGGVTTISYPQGYNGMPTSNPQFAWDDRASLDYSLTPDFNAAVLTTVTIESDNTNTALAKVGDTITVTMVSDEYLPSDPVVEIAGHVATVAVGATRKEFTATYEMASGDTSGNVDFTIDIVDNTGLTTTVSSTTDMSAVTFDKTAPTATLLYSIDAGSNYFTTLSVKNADTLRIKATFSEALLDSPVVKLAIDNAILSATNMTKTNTTTYYYDLNVPAGDVATATCSLSVGTDAAGNVVTAAPTNATFTVDNTAPAMSSAVRDSDTQITVTLSQVATTASITKANDGGFTVTETGGVATYTVSAIAPGATNDKVVLTVANMLVSGKEGVTVTYTAGGNGTVQDATGNTMATDGTGVLVTAWDTTAPIMSSAERLSNTVVKVTLSENADDATITHANDGGFVVFETGTPATTYAVSAIAKSGSNSNMIELTVADMTASAAIGVTVTYATGGNGDVADVAGNAMITDATGVDAASWA